MSFRVDWHRLVEWLESEEYPEAPPSPENQFCRRLVTVICAENASAMDLAVVTRDALRAAVVNEIPNPALPVGIKLSEATPNLGPLGVFISATNHVHLLDAHVPKEFVASYRLEQRRFLAEATIDIALQEKLNIKNIRSYLGVGQQSAVRGTLLADQGRTIIINLPTGCGKSLVAHALMAYSHRIGLTLVVVPTIALAIEQARNVAKILQLMRMDHGGPYSWRSDLAASQKREIKNRIENGTQKILFCSPESVYRGLLRSLCESARGGTLTNLVVDEAHLIEQWGADFRPEFQVLSAVLSRLEKLSKNPIKKVFMSATLRQTTVRLISRLFPDTSGLPLLINGSFLRPEPTYQVFKEESENRHSEKVVESILDMPRPLIIYCSTKNEVAYWSYQLQMLGFNRHARFDGNTGNEKRVNLIENWSEDNLDVMVATKAFGVGMDKSSIRSIIRISVPENLDLFYQEVGRSGRDGCASNARLICTDQQKSLAYRLNRQTLQGVENGFDRWKTMWRYRETIGDGTYVVDLTKVRPRLDLQTDLNWEWNWKTLLLMQRTGLLRTELQLDKDITTHSEGSWKESQDRLGLKSPAASKVIVQNLHDEHLNYEFWLREVDKLRTEELENQKEGYDQIVSWIDNPHSTLCDRLLAFYEIEEDQPEYACGGCPGCLGNGDLPIAAKLGKDVWIHGLNTNPKANSDSRSDTIRPIFFTDDHSPKALLTRWAPWIAGLIEKNTIDAVRSQDDWLFELSKRLPRGLRKFWVTLKPFDESPLELRELGIAFYGDRAATKILCLNGKGYRVGDRRIKSEEHYNRMWFESDSSSISLENFLQSDLAN